MNIFQRSQNNFFYYFKQPIISDLVNLDRFWGSIKSSLMFAWREKTNGKRSVMKSAEFVVAYPHFSPALRKAPSNSSLSVFLLYLDFLIENLGCILSTSAASARASSSRPDKL